MAFLDDLGRTLSDKGREAAQMAKEVAELVQLKTQLSAEKSRLRDLYSSIGKAYYEKHQQEEDGEFSKSFAVIRQSFQKMEELERKIGQLDGSKMCSACGAPMAKDAAFCSKCGAKADDVKKEMLVLGDKAFEEDVFEEDILEEDTVENNVTEEDELEEVIFEEE